MTYHLQRRNTDGSYYTVATHTDPRAATAALYTAQRETGFQHRITYASGVVLREWPLAWSLEERKRDTTP